MADKKEEISQKKEAYNYLWKTYDFTGKTF